MGKLLISKSGYELQEIELEHGSISIGRAKDNDVQLNDATVSSHHAKIVTVMSTSYIQDLGSTNGIFVNGQPVVVQALHPDDVISIGNHEILFQQKNASQSSQDENVYDTQLINSMANASPSNVQQKPAVSNKAFTDFRDTINFSDLSQANPGLRVVVDNTSGSVNQHSLDIDINVEKFEEDKSPVVSNIPEEAEYHENINDQIQSTIPPYVEVPPVVDNDDMSQSGLKVDEQIFTAAQHTRQQEQKEASNTVSAIVDSDGYAGSDADVPAVSPRMRSKQPFMSSEEVVEQLIIMGRDKAKRKQKSSSLSTLLGILIFVAIAVSVYFQLQ